MDGPEPEDEPCEQCGLCCRIFGPGIAPTAANVYLWIEQGQADILHWFVAFMEDSTQVRCDRLAAGDLGNVVSFQMRHPETGEARIISITLKTFPKIVGDGTRSIRDLVHADPRARILEHIYCRRHETQLNRVLQPGEEFPLVFAGNHAQGAIFKDGTHLATPELLARLHGIAESMPDFFFGRFDIRFESLDTFLQGNGIHIVEINGAGAESTHIWDANMTLAGAYKALFMQWRILFEIGAANRRRGAKPIGPLRLLRDCWWYRNSSRNYPVAH